MSLSEHKEECYILDDEELAKASQEIKPEPDYEKRQWKVKDSERNKNPFQKGYIKSVNTFPPAFQYKMKSTSPRQTSTTNVSTLSLLEKVKNILIENPTYTESNTDVPESRTPPYGPD